MSSGRVEAKPERLEISKRRPTLGTLFSPSEVSSIQLLISSTGW